MRRIVVGEEPFEVVERLHVASDGERGGAASDLYECEDMGGAEARYDPFSSRRECFGHVVVAWLWLEQWLARNAQ